MSIYLMCLYNGTPIFNKKRGDNIENVRKNFKNFDFKEILEKLKINVQLSKNAIYSLNLELKQYFSCSNSKILIQF